MPGSFGSPYRAPCGGWPAVPRHYGGCYQHARASEDNIPEWENTTTIEDPNNPGNYIPPYPRESLGADWPDTGDCPGAPAPPRVPGSPPQYGPWDPSEYPACPDPDASHATYSHNCYHATGNTLDFSTCRKVGFKNVQARKVWHGRFGFLSHDCYNGGTGQYGRPDQREHAISGSPCTDYIELEQTYPDTIKYLTYSLSTEYSVTDSGAGNTSATAEQSATVNRFSGVISTSCSLSGDQALQPNAEQALADAVAWSPLSSWDYFDSLIGQWTNTFPLGSVDVSTPDNGQTINVEVTVNGDTWHSASYTVASGNFSRSAYDLHDSSMTLVATESLSFTNTTFSYSAWSLSWYYGGATEYSREVNIDSSATLSDPYHHSGTDSLQFDLTALLATWDLTNDLVYPWRLDEFVSVAPLVSYNEVSSPADPASGLGHACSEEWSDPNAATYDASVIGAPLPAGHGPHFDFNHQTWRVCRNANFDDDWYIYAYGAWSGQSNANDPTDAAMPKTATQWTDNYSATNLPGGAWLLHSGGVIRAQKWAEIKIPRPSQNFARPCGPDRFALNEPTARCVVQITGDGSPEDPFVVEIESPSASIATDDPCLVEGSEPEAANGLWTVTKLTDTSYELSTFIATNPQPSALNQGTFGKLMWPSAPAICGRIPISNVSNQSPIQITLLEPSLLRTGDQVLIAGVLGNTAANGTFTVTVVDTTHFTLDNTTGNGDYSGGGFVSSSGAPAYQWHDDRTKGDWLFVQWTHNYRDIGENDRLIAQCSNHGDCTGACPAPDVLRPDQASNGMPRSVASMLIQQKENGAGCVPFTPCYPQVLAISPNRKTESNPTGEEFPNGAIQPFPTLDCDDRYTAAWQAVIIQHLPDPLWLARVGPAQQPHKPCEDGAETDCAWLEDPGDCQPDLCSLGTGQLYYPQRPWVEARQALPSGAPSLPSGVHIGFLQLADLQDPDPPDGNVLPPPSLMYYAYPDPSPTPAITPWGIWARESNCVCGYDGDGRFAPDYQANGINPKCAS
jgi:hypothetical protein